MTPFELYSLALEAIGHLLVAASILYAARQWVITQKSFSREIARDTRNFIAEMDDRISNYQKQIIEMDISPDNVFASKDNSLPVRQLLNTLELMASEVHAGFYDAETLGKYVAARAAHVLRAWATFIEATRASGGALVWCEVEHLVAAHRQDMVGAKLRRSPQRNS